MGKAAGVAWHRLPVDLRQQHACQYGENPSTTAIHLAIPRKQSSVHNGDQQCSKFEFTAAEAKA
jgi:hypothetical protein